MSDDKGTDRTVVFDQATIEAFVSGVDPNPIHQGSNAVVPGFLISAWAKHVSDDLALPRLGSTSRFAWQRSVLKLPIRAGDEIIAQLDDIQQHGSGVTVKWCLYNKSRELVSFSTVEYRPVASQTAVPGSLTLSFMSHQACRDGFWDFPSYCVSLASRVFADVMRSTRVVGEQKAVVFRSHEITAYAGLTTRVETARRSSASSDYHAISLSARVEKVRGEFYTLSATGARADNEKMFDVQASLAVVDKSRLEREF